MALSPLGHTERGSTQRGPGLGVQTQATFLCVRWGWGWGVGWETCTVQMAMPSTAHPPSGRSPISAGAHQRRAGQRPAQHPQKRQQSAFWGPTLRVDTQRRLLSTDHPGAPGCQVLGFLCVSPFCLADALPGNNGVAPPVPSAPRPCPLASGQ